MELCLNPKKNSYVSGDLGDVGVPSSSNISIFQSISIMSCQ